MLMIDVWDFVNMHGINEIALWGQSLSRRDQAKLDQKVAMLQRMDANVLEQTRLLRPTSPGSPTLQLRVKGDETLCPLLCRGPLNPTEYTFLAGAIEVKGQLEPDGVLDWAERHRSEAEQEGRRCRHEWFSRRTDPGFSE